MADPRSNTHPYQTGFASQTTPPVSPPTNMNPNLAGLVPSPRPPGTGGYQGQRPTGPMMTGPPTRPGLYQGQQPPPTSGQYPVILPPSQPPSAGSGQYRMTGPQPTGGQSQMAYQSPVGQPQPPSIYGLPRQPPPSGATKMPEPPTPNQPPTSIMPPISSQPLMNSQPPISTIGGAPMGQPGPPLPGQQYHPYKPGSFPPHAPLATQPTMPNSGTVSGMPAMELPLPFKFQHTLTSPSPIHSNIPSPCGSDPPSARSSAAPSPIPSGRFDALEGGTPYNPMLAGPNLIPPGHRGSPQSPSTPPTGPFTSPRPGPSTGSHMYPQQPSPVGPPSGSPIGHPPGPPTGQLTSSQTRPPIGPPSGSPMGAVSGPPTGQTMTPPMPGPPPPTSMPGPPPPTSMTGPPIPTPQDMQGRNIGITGKRSYPQYPNATNISGPPPLPTAGQGLGMGRPVGAQTGPVSGVLNDTFNQPRPGQQMNAQAYQQPHSQYENNLSSSVGKLNIQHGDTRPINLLQNRKILPSTPVEAPKANLSSDYKKLMCSPDVFRSTLTSIPQTQQLLNKSKLPLGVLIHPFKDLTHLPVIQSSVIVRCRSCRTYINPFVSFVDHRRWKCNLCYRVNDLPEEFNFDPVTRTYGEPQRRPEIKSATIEFIAPSEYMLRPPQPATYLFMLDVCFNAVESGYLSVACQVLLEELDKLPGDARTMIGFITYDSTLHFYNLQEGLSRPSMMVVSDLEDIFLPCPNDLLVNLQESKELIQELLNQLPSLFSGNKETQSALGPALQAALKLLSPVGGRVTVFQSCLPSIGPGALKSREDMSQRANVKDIPNLGPATDFYKKMSLDCSAQQIAVDLFLFANNYVDIASLSCVSKYSGGCVEYYPAFHTIRTPAEVERFENDFRRYLTRKIGFEAVMRIRCTKGLSIHTFHGNFFVRSTDLLSLPNINPDAGFAMQMSIEDSLNDSPLACFQAALLYTSSKGERRIRVHTLALPVTNQLTEVYAGADQQAIIALLARMAVDRASTATIVDARDALVNVCIDSLCQFKGTLSSTGQAPGALMCPNSLKLLPLYVLALLKNTAFKLSSAVRLDERTSALDAFKYQPVVFAMLLLHPDMYPVHELTDEGGIMHDDQVIPQPPILSLSSEHLYRNGAYLLDRGNALYLYINRDISPEFVQSVLDVPDFQSIPEEMHELPELQNPVSDRLRNFIQYLEEKRPFHAPLYVIREDSRQRILFLRHLVEDRSESSMSYYEFLQHLQKEVGK